ncbi:recombinase family protein [Bengtsoniella intestinalis]|uniref:recombinase family protein n=1 Tax=Bengtsoniella intestinalis TaxID=3073143 RepID=UPI00391EFD7C
MSNRKTLYGYTIQNGTFTTVASESETVKNIYDWYCEGSSYLTITNRLNSEGISYWMDNPLWNKHKVKRLLENPRYTGQDGYPPIIPEKTFRMVQCIIGGKGSKGASAEKSSPTKLPITPSTYTYTPTATVLRNNNQINHGLDHPDNPNEVIDLILQGISIRYQCLNRQE